MNNYFQGKRILITGASGYLAGHLIQRLVPLKAEIHCLSRKDRISSIPREIVWTNADISQIKTWQQVLPHTDIVFHFAAQTSVKTAEANPAEDARINIQPVKHLIQTLRDFSHLQLSVLFSGTVTQCGIPKRIPVDETHPDNPITVYDKHKLEAETLLLNAASDGLFRAVSLRLCNIYGPGKITEKSDRGILNKMILRAAASQPLTLIQGAENFIRDYLYIDDAISAFLDAARSIEKISGRFFVIGSGQGTTLGHAFQKIAEKTSQKSGKLISMEKITGELSDIDQRNFIANASAFIDKTGWKPRYSLDQGIDLMLEKHLCVS